MKTVKKIAVILGLGALTGAAAYATASERAYLETCLKDPAVPVPYVVVSPTVGPEFKGGIVQLEFTVDAAGKPSEFSVTSATDDVLAKEVVRAVKLWKFRPAEVDGKAVVKRVSLPVKIVDEPEWAITYTASK